MNDIFYIHILRVLAMFAVVFFHIGVSHSFRFDIETKCILDVLLNFCVPIFLMVTGALFLGTDKKVTFDVHWKRVRRLVILTFVSALGYNLLASVLVEKNVGLHIICNALKMAITGDTLYCYHLWYLYMVCGLYMLIPIIKPYWEKSSDNERLILLCITLLFGIIIPGGAKLCFGMEKINFWQGAFFYFGGYLVYIVLGGYLHLHQISKKNAMILNSVAIVSFVLFAVLSVVLGEEKYTRLTGYNSIITCLLSICLFVNIRVIANDVYQNYKIRSIVLYFSSVSLWVYILHVAVLMGLRKTINLTTEFAPYIISAPIMIILAVFICCMIVWVTALILKKTHLLR